MCTCRRKELWYEYYTPPDAKDVAVQLSVALEASKECESSRWKEARSCASRVSLDTSLVNLNLKKNVVGMRGFLAFSRNSIVIGGFVPLDVSIHSCLGVVKRAT